MIFPPKTQIRNTKGKLFLYAFQLSSFFSRNWYLKIIGFPIRLLYQFLIQWVLGIDIPDTTKIGKGLNVYHGQGLVINSSVLIGEHVTLRQNTTIGNARPNGGSPVISNNVQVGANSVIIGEITIGENTIIAAGSVVVKDVASNVVVAGNPAQVIKQLMYE